MTAFTGFQVPEQNWSQLSHEFISALPIFDTMAEIKVVLYILRHTWGYKEYDTTKRITLDEFMHGRKRKDGTRLDDGIGMAKNSVIDGLERAINHGFICAEIDNSDKARIEKCYAISMVSNSDVQLLNPDVQKLNTGAPEVEHRTEKETLERNLEKENLMPQPEKTVATDAEKVADLTWLAAPSVLEPPKEKGSGEKEKVPFAVLHDSTPLGRASALSAEQRAGLAALAEKYGPGFGSPPNGVIPSALSPYHEIFPSPPASADAGTTNTDASSAAPAPVTAPETRHDSTTPAPDGKAPAAYNSSPADSPPPGFEWRAWNGFKHLVKANLKTPHPKFACGAKYDGAVTTGPAFGGLIPCAACLEKAAKSKPKQERKPQPWDAVFDAMACGLSKIPVVTPEAKQANGWRIGTILHGDKKHGRCQGLFAYEKLRQHKDDVQDLDFTTLAADVGKFWLWFHKEHAGLDLKDCAKFLEYWSVYINLQPPEPVWVPNPDGPGMVTPAQARAKIARLEAERAAR